ncbi:MAG: HEAT repeat domain-containing protein [Gemmataceae bacterium]|nr:HEAT repeat domain-containing protein [Gemmataceae bacterium]
MIGQVWLRPSAGWLVVFGLVLTGCTPEPRYEGQTASAWRARLKSRTLDDRWRAAEALGHLVPADAESVRALAEATRDPETAVRFHAVQALGRLGPAAAPAAPELRERAEKDPTYNTRDLAAKILARLGEGPARDGAGATGRGK